MSRTVHPPSRRHCRHSATRRTPTDRIPFLARALVRVLALALVPILGLAAAGAFPTHASAATPPARSRQPAQSDQTRGSDPGRAQSGQAGQGSQGETGDARPYLEMRRAARERAQDRARARRSARTGDALSAEERIAKIVENVWWNDPELAERAHLTDTQRQTMDDLLRANLAGRRKALDATRDAQKAFYAALEAGDPEAAAGHLDAVDSAQAAIVRSQLQLRLAVAKLLAPDQRTTLTQTRPRLWRERWIRLEPRANTARRGRDGAKTEPGSGS